LLLISVFNRKFINSLCLFAVRTLVKFLHTATGLELRPGVVAVIRPLLSLKRLFFDGTAGKVSYQYSKDGSQEVR